MAVDVGTGVIELVIDRQQLQREAAQSSRFLAQQRMRVNPQIDRQRLAQRLRQALQRAGGRQTWQPFAREGEQAMDRVGLRGVAAMRAVEMQGLQTAARLRAAFAGVVPTAAVSGGVAQATAQAQVSQVRIPQQAAQNARSVARDATSAALGNAGFVGQIAQQAIAAGPTAGIIAGAAVGGAFFARRFQQQGGFQGFNAATSSNVFGALGLRGDAVSEAARADTLRATGAALVGDASGDAALALEALARAARDAATNQQRARAQRDAPGPQPSQPRQRRESIFQDPGRLIRTGLMGPFAPFAQAAVDEIYNRRIERLNAEEGELEAAGQDIANATDDERRAARQAADIREGIALFNEQRIESLAQSVQEQKAETDLLTGTNAQSRRYQQVFGNQRLQAARRSLAEQRLENNLLTQNTTLARDYQRVAVEQNVAQRQAEIYQRRQAREIRRQLLQTQGLTRLERLRVRFEGLATAIAGWTTAIAVAAVATYALVRAVVRSEQVAAAQVAAGSIAQARVPGGDLAPITEGIRAGADQGLSDLQVYRTAIDAIRTGSRDIFENTEQVLGDLRVVAAATGVAFEDATTRFFRGIIKREQELLDELGIVARVEAANARYAQSLGVAASALTPFQQQLAFATEVQRQLTISAQDFGRDSVRSTQRATIALDRLSASFSNLIAETGEAARIFALPLTRFAEGIVAIARNIVAPFRAISTFFLGGRPDPQPVSEINRLERQRNEEIAGRVALLTRAATAGNLDVEQQRRLLNLQRDIAAQQRDLQQQPAGAISARNLDLAGQNRLLVENTLVELREGREESRIAGIQGPLRALLSSLEGAGRVAYLTQQAYEDLTRGTEESEEAIRNLAAEYDLSVGEVRNLIEMYNRLDSVQEKQVSNLLTITGHVTSVNAGMQIFSGTLQDLLRELDRILRFGPLRSQRLQAVIDALDATTFDPNARSLIDRLEQRGELDFQPVSDLTQTMLPGLTAAQREAQLQAELVLTAEDRFALAAGQIGLTLDNMSSAFADFADDLFFEAENIGQAVQAYIRNLARTVVRTSGENIGQQIFGALGLTNVTGGGGGTNYNTNVNIGIDNPLQARSAAASARLLSGG